MPDASSDTTPRDRGRRRRRGAGGGDEPTGPQQLIEAAVASIQEIGFYRSSTNEIARRANVSWGAVQYHFGTREALLLAVVKDHDARFNAMLEAATVTGKTLEDRLGSLYRILGPLYEDPWFLVRIQILLNLQHDPDTSGEVKAELTAQAAVVEQSIHRLLTETLGRAPDPATADVLYHSIRGYALSRHLSRALPAKASRTSDAAALKRFLHNLAVADEASS